MAMRVLHNYEVYHPTTVRCEGKKKYMAIYEPARQKVVFYATNGWYPVEGEDVVLRFTDADGNVKPDINDIDTMDIAATINILNPQCYLESIDYVYGPPLTIENIWRMTDSNNIIDIPNKCKDIAISIVKRDENEQE